MRTKTTKEIGIMLSESLNHTFKIMGITSTHAESVINQYDGHDSYDAEFVVKDGNDGTCFRVVVRKMDLTVEY